MIERIGTMANALPLRRELDQNLTWNLTDIYPTDRDWGDAFKEVQRLIDAFPGYADKLSVSPQALLTALEAESHISLALERLYVYARMNRDEDNTNPVYQGMADQAMQLSVAFQASSSFMAPQILALGTQKLSAWIDDPILVAYRRVLIELERARPHTLSATEERLMAFAGDPLQAADTIFSMLHNADIRFGIVKNEKGDEIQLSQGNYRSFMESTDRIVRQNAYTTLYRSYEALKNTMAATYAASVKADVFYARARHHGSAIEGALFGSNVPISVYDCVIEAVISRLPTMERYLALRREKLQLEKLHMYDLYVPIVDYKPAPLPYAESQKLVKAALAPLGVQYAALLDRAFNERWIDVCENRGKTTGAYSWGVYGTHPYVLLNYQEECDNYAYTVAHELGHAMHTYYSDASLPYQDAQYKIMAAEVTSTVNEILLTHYLLKHVSDKTRRAYILNHYLEQFRTTVFRQTMFAKFERQTHSMCESNDPLTVASLCELYGKLNEQFYPGVIVDEQIRLEWARIPHFYNAFYVYQYATGFCVAVKLARDILNGSGLDRYLAFLKSGGSDYPIALLQRAGVDLSRKESLLLALDEFDKAVDELAAL
jgi:oligoendopeptidase F